MATVDKNFKVKNGLIVGDSTNLVNYTSASPSNPFVGQLWISASSLYAWSSASTWVLIGDGAGGGSASGTPLNIPNTLVSRSASGTFSIGAIDFDTGSSLPAKVGRMTWDASEGTLDLGISNNKHIHIGEDAVYRVRNSTESTILKGTALYASGVESSGRIQVSPYVADGSIREVRFMGLATENINSGVNGFVQHFGYVKDLDTRGTSSTSISVGDENWSAGDILYVHPTQPGKLTNIKPQHAIIVALLIIRHQTSGVLFVRPSSGGHLEDIHDILITNASNNDILSYNVSSSVWFNQNLATAITEVDGTGSGIDADLLDGEHGSHYLDWTNTTNKPGPIVAVNLTGNTTGAASATLTDLTNGQISIDTKTSHATSASSIAGSLVEGVVASANFTVNSNQLGGYNESYFLNTSSAVQTKYGNLNIGGTLTTHNLYVSGSTTSINTSSLEVNDPVIYIGLSQYSSDVLDLGFIAPYGDIGSSSVAGNHNHTGLIRDHSDKKWKLLANANHPINNLFDFNSPSVTYATLIVGSIEVSSSATVNNFSADMLDGYHQGHFLPAGTASATYLSQANASATYVIQQDFDNIVVLQWMGIG